MTHLLMMMMMVCICLQNPDVSIYDHSEHVFLTTLPSTVYRYNDYASLTQNQFDMSGSYGNDHRVASLRPGCVVTCSFLGMFQQGVTVPGLAPRSVSKVSHFQKPQLEELLLDSVLQTHCLCDGKFSVYFNQNIGQFQKNFFQKWYPLFVPGMQFFSFLFKYHIYTIKFILLSMWPMLSLNNLYLFLLVLRI